jgi:hypothetical protein
MPTKDNFEPDHSLPVFFADEPEQQDIGKPWDRSVIWSPVLKGSVVVVTATAIGLAVLSIGNPVTIFAEVGASRVDKSALPPGTDLSMPKIQSTAEAEALPPTAKDTPISDEIAVVADSAGQNQPTEPAGQRQTGNREPSNEALFREFQAWAAEKDAQAQSGPVQSVQDAPAQVAENARAQKQLRPVQSARAEIRPAQNPRKRLRREQTARAQVAPGQDARAQDQSGQNAQTPSFLQIFGLHN